MAKVKVFQDPSNPAARVEVLADNEHKIALLLAHDFTEVVEDEEAKKHEENIEALKGESFSDEDKAKLEEAIEEPKVEDVEDEEENDLDDEEDEEEEAEEKPKPKRKPRTAKK